MKNTQIKEAKRTKEKENKLFFPSQRVRGVMCYLLMYYVIVDYVIRGQMYSLPVLS